MESTEVNLSSLYKELQKLESDDFGKALVISEKILKHFPDEEEAFQCKIVCLIQLSKFKEALVALESNKQLLEQQSFERAYCLYRLNDPRTALEVITSSKTSSLKLQELEAQVLYRLERYDECFKTYREIIKQSHDNFEDERMTNLSAVVASIISTQQYSKKETPQLGEHTYELLYNSACRLAEEGHYVEARKKLQAAEKLCRESLEESGATEDEILDELAVIRTQTAYCQQKLGKEKEAQNIYNSIIKQKPKDISILAVASNNSVVINKDQNIFDSKKKIKACTAESTEFKLTSRQRGAIACNQCLFALYNSQSDYCLQLCDKLETNFPLMREYAVLIKSVVLAKDKKVSKAVELLKDYAAKNSENQLKPKLTAVQLLLSEVSDQSKDNKEDAFQLLESLVKLNYKPGIVSALITLYTAKGERSKAIQLLDETVSWHTTHKDSGIDLKSFWKQAADVYLRENNAETAVNCLQELLLLDPRDKKTIAKLVIAYVKFDKSKAAEYSDKLPAIKLDDADISTLENIAWHSNKQKKQKVQPSPGTGGKSSGTEINQKVKKKKKRKLKLPKNYDPNIPPDPERWLPKYERSNYKKKKDRRFRDTNISKGTQGAAGTSSDQYDITKRTPTTGGQQSSSGHAPRLQNRSKIQHKRKKKGGR